MNISKGLRSQNLMALLLTLLLGALMGISALFTNPTQAKASETSGLNYFIVNDSNFDFADYLDTARSQNKNAVKVTASQPSVGNAVIGSEFKELTGNPFFGDKANIGNREKGTVTFKSGADILVKNINFKDESNDDRGITVIIEEGARVKFENCNFAKELTNRGNASFNNCTFKTKSIKDFGTATYSGSTEKPENKAPKLELSIEENNVDDLQKNLNDKRAKSEDFTGVLPLNIGGANKDRVKVNLSVEPENDNIIVNSSADKSSLELSVKKALPAGDYTIKIKVSADAYQPAEKTITLKIDPIKEKSKLEPNLEALNGSEWIKGSNKTLSFKSKATLDNLTEVMIDHSKIDAKYYETRSGSTIVDLRAKYLETLSEGKHTITLAFKESAEMQAGKASADFIVKVKTKENKSLTSGTTSNNSYSPSRSDAHSFYNSKLNTSSTNSKLGSDSKSMKQNTQSSQKLNALPKTSDVENNYRTLSLTMLALSLIGVSSLKLKA